MEFLPGALEKSAYARFYGRVNTGNSVVGLELINAHIQLSAWWSQVEMHLDLMAYVHLCLHLMVIKKHRVQTLALLKDYYSGAY